ncbi:hypothetical protein PoB_001186800 [Plakobranchus ocellatus]|uniref:Uncharacterized protein n=1 Tax=Plakobranchus ocellatus TaxID=259542 RepID=A0AAV3YSL9_9GAST|nr:hypothetical protein PoB_001186800 [Plakobranchus ocellatus]
MASFTITLQFFPGSFDVLQILNSKVHETNAVLNIKTVSSDKLQFWARADSCGQTIVSASPTAHDSTLHNRNDQQQIEQERSATDRTGTVSNRSNRNGQQQIEAVDGLTVTGER